MQSFDIKSCSEIDMSKFQWATGQDNYIEIRKIIIDVLNDWKSINNPEQFNVVYFQILKALVEYITIYYDIEKAKTSHQIKFDFIKNNFVKSIVEKKKINEIFNYDLELKRFPKKKINFLFSKLYLKIGSVFKKKLTITKNELIQIYLDNNNSCLYIPPVYLLKIPSKTFIKKNNSTTILAKMILEKLIEYNSIFEKIILENLENIINAYVNRFEIDIKKLKILKKSFISNESIITGTGDQYFNQLISFFSKINNINNYRFDHGGEKSFFIDREFLSSEFQNINSYFTYSKKISKNLLTTIKDNDIEYHGKFEIIKSKNLEKISKIKKEKILEDSNKLIYVSQSFVGNSRNLEIRLNDPLLYFWKFNLLSNLKNRGYKVVYKKHPKGVFNSKKLSDLSYETSYQNLSELLSKDNIFIFDYVGTAFIETLVANKKVILISPTIREKSDQYKDLMKYVSLITCNWKNNLPIIDFDSLCNEIEKLKNKEDDPNLNFYNNYYN